MPKKKTPETGKPKSGNPNFPGKIPGYMQEALK